MSDYLLQTMRAGIGGVSAWDLDDSMHPQAKIAPTPANPHAYNLKVWGFWNTLGGVMGKPEDENLRPWFYPWSLLCRSFPRGMKMVSVSGTAFPVFVWRRRHGRTEAGVTSAWPWSTTRTCHGPCASSSRTPWGERR